MQHDIEGFWWKIAVVVVLAAVGLWLRRKTVRSREESKETIETLNSATIALAVVFFVVQPFIAEAFVIPTGSMKNTLREQDRVLVSRAIYRLQEPHFQDVVVFEAPPAAHQEAGTDFIKRCIGTPGDVIEMRRGVLFRNGRAVPEIYQLWNSPTLPYDMKIVGGAVYSRDYYAPNLPGAWQQNQLVVPAANQFLISTATPGRVPNGQLLMLGDHRSNSLDGHFWGFVSREKVIGKAMCVFWPPRRFGLLDEMTRNPRVAP